jgi:hypothetical protein
MEMAMQSGPGKRYRGMTGGAWVPPAPQLLKDVWIGGGSFYPLAGSRDEGG